MKIRIGTFNPETVKVPVTFKHASVTHRRDVNAVLTDAGDYDASATRTRVQEVANGVIHKIAAGVLPEQV